MFRINKHFDNTLTNTCQFQLNRRYYQHRLLESNNFLEEEELSKTRLATFFFIENKIKEQNKRSNRSISISLFVVRLPSALVSARVWAAILPGSAWVISSSHDLSSAISFNPFPHRFSCGRIERLITSGSDLIHKPLWHVFASLNTKKKVRSL